MRIISWKCVCVYALFFVKLCIMYCTCQCEDFPWIPLRRKWLEALRLYLHNLDKMIEMWSQKKIDNISDLAAWRLILRCALGSQFNTLNRFFFRINSTRSPKSLSFSPPLCLCLCLSTSPHADAHTCKYINCFTIISLFIFIHCDDLYTIR